jgi:hypothetical protein
VSDEAPNPYLEKLQSISLPTQKRGSPKWRRGSTTEEARRIARQAAAEPGATRQSIEREVLRAAVGAGSQAKFAEIMQAGLVEGHEAHTKQPEGVTVRPINGEKPKPDEGK